MKGGYVWASLVPCPSGKVAVGVHDGDDSSVVKECATREEAQAEMETLKQLVSFALHELADGFGYRWD